MYKLLKLLPNQEMGCVFHLEKNICIPFDPNNTDYQIYLKWLAEGNTPEPADE
jgi:hypothetical protein